MENYQMLFPCSSSSMAVSGYPAHVVSSTMESSQNNESAFSTGTAMEGLGGRISHGFLGLGTENQNQNQNQNYQNHQHLHHRDDQTAKMMTMMMMNNNKGHHDHDDHDDDQEQMGKKSTSSSSAGTANNCNNNNNKKKGVKKVKKPKYAFQTRSQVDILDDGYRWRKYGQKSVKNNRFPRSYYRCTHHGCNVKKQVQRLTKDEGVVVTTYEGMHTHPIEKHTDNFEHILNQMHIYTPF
ncbi:probable WRKY transcription factor 75 [Humulus lupulus]|uniref:probable WRKY transcription factor 75 n=1 Tax=Humulus lupulus TaxID=3486 RepID=UPI002B41639A|nr:probable WRKY transcription factor 75 [Humulus lupulus]